MKSKEPEDIIRARALLRKYEQTADHQERARYFSDALEILDQFVEESGQDAKMTLLANNIKRSYLKNTIESLPSFGFVSMLDWLTYLVPLVKHQDEVGVICSKHEQLKIYYQNFLNLWGQELSAMAEKSKKE
jgi:hypothetical protein